MGFNKLDVHRLCLKIEINSVLELKINKIAENPHLQIKNNFDFETKRKISFGN